jgi:hypothetical protein
MLASKMVQLSDFALFVEQSPLFPRGGLAEPIPPIPDFDLEMPRLYKRPSAPPLRRASRAIQKLLALAGPAYRSGDSGQFGKTYGALSSEFRADLQWILSCWDYLLSTQGCRFLARNSQEKLYSRGDYRLFGRNDFEGLVYRSFRECLVSFASQPKAMGFERFLRDTLWTRISDGYRRLEQPADPNQRRLTAYSYLRCAPYQFLNRYHHERVYRVIRRLPFPLRQTVELYHLSFYREEAASNQAGLTPLEFRRKRWSALKAIARKDYLSFRLLRQIERY